MLCIMMNQSRTKEQPAVTLHELAPDIWTPEIMAEHRKAEDAKMKSEMYKELAQNLRVQ